MPREIPLLMTGPLVLKSMAGEKTQTRRLKFRGEVGDKIWVKETFQGPLFASGSTSATRNHRTGAGLYVHYVADGRIEWHHEEHGLTNRATPSIYMPKWACRLWLEVTSMRVEALNDITEDDARAEGVALCGADCSDARGHFQSLWDSINYAKAPWVSNPAVHVVGFKRVDAKENRNG